MELRMARPDPPVERKRPQWPGVEGVAASREGTSGMSSFVATRAACNFSHAEDHDRPSPSFWQRGKSSSVRRT